jgi:hypothetical protein
VRIARVNQPGRGSRSISRRRLCFDWVEGEAWLRTNGQWAKRWRICGQENQNENKTQNG